MNRQTAIDLISRVIPVQVVRERPAELQKVLSPWAVTAMTPGAFYLDEYASDEELFHELGHCIAWVQAGRPEGLDWGFPPDREPGTFDPFATEGDWELDACAIGVFCEMAVGALTLAEAAHRMSDAYCFDGLIEDSGLSAEEWTQQLLDEGRVLLDRFIRETAPE